MNIILSLKDRSQAYENVIAYWWNLPENLGNTSLDESI